MKKLNFIAGLFNKFIGILLLVAGWGYLSAAITRTGNLSATISILEVFKVVPVVDLIVTAALFIIAVTLFIYGTYDIAMAARVDLDGQPKKRGVFAVITNILLVGIALAAIIYVITITLQVIAFKDLPLVTATFLALAAVVSLVLFILLFVRLGKLVKKPQEVKVRKALNKESKKAEKRKQRELAKVKIANVKETKKAQRKQKREDKKREKADKKDNRQKAKQTVEKIEAKVEVVEEPQSKDGLTKPKFWKR